MKPAPHKTAAMLGKITSNPQIQEFKAKLKYKSVQEAS